MKAWASMKSFQPKERATSSSDQSTAESDPMTRPTRRNRNAEVDGRGERRSNATHASRTDPEARLFKKSPAPDPSGRPRLRQRQMVVTPHVAQKSRNSAIDGRTTRHPGYAKSQQRRKKIEEPFGWVKTVGGMAQTLYRGIERGRARFTLAMVACKLARLPKLLAA